MSLRRLRVVRDRLITRLLWNRLIAGDKNELILFREHALRGAEFLSEGKRNYLFHILPVSKAGPL